MPNNKCSKCFSMPGRCLFLLPEECFPFDPSLPFATFRSGLSRICITIHRLRYIYIHTRKTCNYNAVGSYQGGRRKTNQQRATRSGRLQNTQQRDCLCLLSISHSQKMLHYGSSPDILQFTYHFYLSNTPCFSFFSTPIFFQFPTSKTIRI